MPPHQPRYLLAEDVTDRVFVHEGRVWCVLPPAGQEPEPVLEVVRTPILKRTNDDLVFSLRRWLYCLDFFFSVQRCLGDPS